MAHVRASDKVTVAKVKSSAPKALHQRQAHPGASRNTPDPPTRPALWLKRQFKQIVSNGQLFTLLLITALPIALSRSLLDEVLRGLRPRAWDGTGHYAAAEIYSRAIFPDSFGWTHAYFAGMPFPNFYPPLFYWLVALLNHTRLFSFSTSFKLVAFAPVLLIPAAVWLLAWAMSGKSRLAATAASFGCIALLLDERFLFNLPAGLDYFSTFQIGLYTQPLGFVLMAAWYALYSGPNQTGWKIALSGLLLALTILANFFAAATAALFVAATITCDLILFCRTNDAGRRTQARRTLFANAAVPLIAACLTLFWIVPMLGQYEYFVTRPYVIEATQLVTPTLWLWYALSAAGVFIWIRHPTRATWPYLGTCLTLAVAVLFATTLSPRWFPLQSPRFLTTLNFLLAVPAGLFLAVAFRKFAALLGEAVRKDQSLSVRQVRYTTGVALVLLAVFALTAPAPRWGGAFAFYREGEKSELDDILEFASGHKDGRYLVEVINPTFNPAYSDASFDARAINSYLGAQGNETLSTVFHEASPNALFTLPAVNALSDFPDSFGVSSVLADDLDFAAQPLSKHIERARFLGVKYFVLRSPVMKERVGEETAVAARHDFGWWSVFELKGEPTPRARSLAYRPALVVSGFTLKQRRRNEWGFIRLAEEQFADGWFDVPLARSPETRIDLLTHLDLFGALILDTYEYDDEDRAYELVKAFSRDRQLIVLSSDSKLFRRIQSARSEFPRLEIIERPRTDPGEPLEAIKPTHHYQSNPIRQAWSSIRRALDGGKVAVGSPEAPATSEVRQNAIHLNPTTRETAVPVLVATTFHPNWHRDDGTPIYAATPFYMLTFVKQPTQIIYERKPHERLALWFSGSTFILLCLCCTLGGVKRLRRRAD